jgi:PAS domain S-box-containing protein
MTIKKKMVLFFLLFAILPTIFVGTLGYITARKSIENIRMADLKSIADLKASGIEDFFIALKEDLLYVKNHPDVQKNIMLLTGSPRNFFSPEYQKTRYEIDRIFKIKQKVHQYLNILFLDPRGKIIYVLHRSNRPERLGDLLPESVRESFDEGKRGFYFSKIFNRKTGPSDQLAMLITAPVLNFEGNLAGVIAFEVALDPILAIIRENKGLEETGEIFITRKSEDVLLFHDSLRYDPKVVLKRISFFEDRQTVPIRQRFEGEEGSGIYLDYRNKQVIVSWRHIQPPDWVIAAKIDASEAFAPANHLMIMVCIITIIAIIMGSFVGIAVANSISDPIQVLEKGIEVIGSGNLNHKVGTQAKDEIGRLGRAFDQMTQNLKAVTASRDELNIEVGKRKRIQTALQESVGALRERVKELNCFFGLSTLIENHTLSMEQILQGSVDLIPPAMRFSKIACAQIILDARKFKTMECKETTWKIHRNIMVNGEPIGILEVFYMQERGKDAADIFLIEEQNMINAVAERLGKLIERKRSEAALRESEKRFRSLVENSLTGISIIQDNEIVYQNLEQQKILGPLPRKFKLLDLDNIHPDDVEKVREFYLRNIIGDFHSMDIDFRFYPWEKKNGEKKIKWIHYRTSPIKYEGKDSILVNIMDMTKTKEMEHLLRIQDKMASLGRIAAAIAHEIRNPLSGINIYLSALEKIYDKGEGTEKIKRIIHQIQNASNKIDSIIKRIMDFSKPLEPNSRLINLNHYIEETVKFYDDILRKKDIQVVKCMADNLPFCFADPQLIEQLILNLIINAVEAMKDMNGNKKIKITSAKEKDRIILRVSDSGPGVPVEIRNSIFEPFYTTKDNSTGVGLSIVHRIVTDHCGKLSVCESDWGGAEFKVDIPIENINTMSEEKCS